MSELISGLTALDARVLNRIEKFARKLQVLTGKTNFFFADLCLAGIGGILLAMDISQNSFSFFDSVVIVFILIRLFFSVYIENKEIERLRKGVANPDKIRPASIIFRLINLSLLPSNLFFLVKGAMKYDFDACFMLVISVLCLLYLYLLARDPLPPCNSRVAEWIKGLFSPKRELVPVREKF